MNIKQSNRSGSSKELRDRLKALGVTVNVDSSVSIRSYYQFAHDIEQTAIREFKEHKNFEQAYVHLWKLVNLLLHEIPKHNSYNIKQFEPDKLWAKRKAKEVLDQLERITTELDRIEDENLIRKQLDLTLIDEFDGDSFADSSTVIDLIQTTDSRERESVIIDDRSNINISSEKYSEIYSRSSSIVLDDIKADIVSSPTSLDLSGNQLPFDDDGKLIFGSSNHSSIPNESVVQSSDRKRSFNEVDNKPTKSLSDLFKVLRIQDPEIQPSLPTASQPVIPSNIQVAPIPSGTSNQPLSLHERKVIDTGILSPQMPSIDSSKPSADKFKPIDIVNPTTNILKPSVTNAVQNSQRFVRMNCFSDSNVFSRFDDRFEEDTVDPISTYEKDILRFIGDYTRFNVPQPRSSNLNIRLNRGANSFANFSFMQDDFHVSFQIFLTRLPPYLQMTPSALETNRCFFVHLGVAIGVHPYTLQTAFRSRTKQLLRMKSTDDLARELLGTVMKAADLVDANVLMYLWPKEFAHIRIAILSGSLDTPILSIFQNFKINQEQQIIEVILRCNGCHFTLLRPQSQNQFSGTTSVLIELSRAMKSAGFQVLEYPIDMDSRLWSFRNILQHVIL